MQFATMMLLHAEFYCINCSGGYCHCISFIGGNNSRRYPQTPHRDTKIRNFCSSNNDRRISFLNANFIASTGLMVTVIIFRLLTSIIRYSQKLLVTHPIEIRKYFGKYENTKFLLNTEFVHFKWFVNFKFR